MAVAQSIRHPEECTYAASAIPVERMQHAKLMTDDIARQQSLPPPVQRYFRTVFVQDPPAFRSARFTQEGVLRTSIGSRRWQRFTAVQRVSIEVPGFAWLARVRVMPWAHLRVRDSYQQGVGAGEVRFSFLRVAHEAGSAQLNSGALHRYLAEAVWYPMALLPRDGLSWTALDETKALATLSDHGVTVDLEFRFGHSGLVSGIYSPGRWGRIAGGFRQIAWEGHFSDYFEQDGVRIPRYGEVGWYDAEEWQPVWKGTIRHAEFFLHASVD